MLIIMIARTFFAVSKLLFVATGLLFLLLLSLTGWKGGTWEQITYDVTNRESFDNIDKVFEEAQSLVDEKATLMLCGSKIDKSDEREISAEEGYSMATKYNAAI